jgi:putative Mg2+ transporter-C (MgtC) family protein
MGWVEQLELVGLVAAAMVLGGAVGLERELARKPAGLRTLMLVAGAAALLVQLGDVLVANYLASATGPGIPAELIRVDPIRIVEAIIAGTSFLGAGTIFRARSADAVQGLTTAASLLFVAGIGVAVAVSQFVVAVGATALALITLRVLERIERRALEK